MIGAGKESWEDRGRQKLSSCNTQIGDLFASPITISEITEALLAINEDSGSTFEEELLDDIDESFVKTEIIELCYSLVELRATASIGSIGSRTLHLTHFTVREYLLQRDPTSGAKLQTNGSMQPLNISLQNNILACDI